MRGKREGGASDIAPCWAFKGVLWGSGTWIQCIIADFSVDFFHLMFDAVLVVFEIGEEFSNRGEVELFWGVGWEFAGHDGD